MYLILCSFYAFVSVRLYLNTKGLMRGILKDTYTIFLQIFAQYFRDFDEF